LKSAHEELQSGNEELQSTNEELLTAKEELQSTNEELTTVNEEMQSRNSELRQLNNDLLNLLTSVNIPIMMLGNDLRIRRFTPHAEKILNLLATDIGRPISDFRLKINVPDLARLCQDVLDDLTARDREVQDAEGRTYSMWIRPYRTAENRIDGVVLALLDITGRKQPAEVRYRRIFETAADGFVVVDAASGEVLDVNPQVVRMFGHARSALVGTRFWEGPLFGGGVMESSVLEELKHSGSLERLRTLRAESGELIQTEIVCTRYLEGVRQVALFTIRNPGARKQTEALVRRQESEVGQTRKLEAVTKLAGGVAHDFGNLLTTILGYCDLLSEQLAAMDGPPRELLAQIRAAAENAARLTRQLLAFGRRHIGPPEIVDLNEAVRGMQQILAISVPGKIRVETDLSPEAGCVVFDRGQLEQVILHLALNAAEAAPDGGRITVKTEAVDVDQDFSRRHPSVPEGQYYVLSVQDSGGALETEREQAFETMYSTMTQGRSPAGFGAVYEIVKRSGGHLWVYSELGVGSTCSIYMPRAQAGSAQPSRIEPVGGSETILLVEDDPALRTMTRLVLGRLGYRVLEAAGGPEALSMARDEGPIHLLITDALLPAMSGRDIASELAPARPEMKVLYISGYPETAFADQGILGDGRAFLPKPFSQSALASKIREALDGNPSG